MRLTLQPLVLRKLISQPACLRDIAKDDPQTGEDVSEDGQMYIYRRGQRTGVFTLVLEGRVKVRADGF